VCAAPGADNWQDCAKGDLVGYNKTACSTDSAVVLKRDVKCSISYYNTTDYSTTEMEVMPWFCDASTQPETTINNQCKYKHKCLDNGVLSVCEELCDGHSTQAHWNGTPTCVDSSSVAVTDADEQYFCAPVPTLTRKCYDSATLSFFLKNECS